MIVWLLNRIGIIETHGRIEISPFATMISKVVCMSFPFTDLIFSDLQTHFDSRLLDNYTFTHGYFLIVLFQYFKSRQLQIRSMWEWVKKLYQTYYMWFKLFKVALFYKHKCTTCQAIKTINQNFNFICNFLLPVGSCWLNKAWNKNLDKGTKAKRTQRDKILFINLSALPLSFFNKSSFSTIFLQILSS